MLVIRQTETFRKWESRLRDQRAKALIAARVFRLANDLKGDVKLVGGGVGELRIRYGPGYRVYFKQMGNEIIILLCGGDKGSQERDIAMAKRLADQVEQS